MPTYVYECAKCGEEVEAWQSFTDEPLKRHSGCGGRLTKVLQPVGIVFKGSGFHRTDSRTGGKRSRGDGSADKDTSSDEKDSSSSSDTSSTSGDGAKESSSKSSDGKGGASKPADTKKSSATAAS
jgi:putative FmdB family regulatory protein